MELLKSKLKISIYNISMFFFIYKNTEGGELHSKSNKFI